MLFENIIFDLKPDNNLYSPKEGFVKGNMFKNEYAPYKNYTPCELNANDESSVQRYSVMEMFMNF